MERWSEFAKTIHVKNIFSSQPKKLTLRQPPRDNSEKYNKVNFRMSSYTG